MFANGRRFASMWRGVRLQRTLLRVMDSQQASSRSRLISQEVISVSARPSTSVTQPSLVARVKAFFSIDTHIDPAVSQIIDNAAVQLSFDCANNFDYLSLCETLQLKDILATWFNLTLLHIWMVLVRCHHSLNAEAYLRLRDGVLIAMWADVEDRLQTLGRDWNMHMKKRSILLEMQGRMLQAFVEYDEGFLLDDMKLAGAVWRCLFLRDDVDTIQLNRGVRYIRENMAYLDDIHVDTLLLDGIKTWKPPLKL